MASDNVYSFAADTELAERVETAAEQHENTSEALRSVVDDGLRVDGTRKHLRSVYEVRLELTPYKLHVVGNRLWGAAQAADDETSANLIKFLARRFHQKAKMARESDANSSLVEMSAFEARFVGEWLHEAAESHDERIGFETAWLRDLFHEQIATRDD